MIVSFKRFKMEGLINKLYSDITDLIQKSDSEKSNVLRFKIGEVISSFYADNKGDFKKKAEVIEEEIYALYKAYNLKQNQLKTDSASWEKIKTALSDVLVKNSAGEGYSYISYSESIQKGC
jgi:hypothetical protein